MSNSNVHPQSVYRRAIEPHRVASDVRLIALEWALYFAADGTRTVAELGRRFRADAPDRDRAIARLVSADLITENALTATEYVHALAAAGGGTERSMCEFLVQAASSDLPAPHVEHDPDAEPRPASRPAAPEAAPARPQLVTRPPRPIVALPFKPLSPLQQKEDRSMVPTRKLSLRALMDVIERRAGNREAGQLDIYRVFIKVDTSLLKRSGIETLRFTDDRLISDPELEDAIVRSMKKTLGLDCPDDAWVDVA